MLVGYIRSLGIRGQRSRIRKVFERLDSKNTALRWGIVITRRKHYVPWPNSLWHMNGQHSLIRWVFRNTWKYRWILQSGYKWWWSVPSKISFNFDVEKCISLWCNCWKTWKRLKQLIEGPSTRNQRIERLRRDVFCCVFNLFYYIFLCSWGWTVNCHWKSCRYVIFVSCVFTKNKSSIKRI